MLTKLSCRNGIITMDMTIHNKAMQPITNFAIQLNKNSFGITPAAPLNVPAPLAPNQSVDVSLTLSTNGPVQRMDPLTNLQVMFLSHLPPVLSLTAPEGVPSSLCLQRGRCGKRSQGKILKY